MEERVEEGVEEAAEEAVEEVEMADAELADDAPEGLMLVVFPLTMKTPFLSEQHCSPIVPFPQQKLPSEHGMTMTLSSAWSGNPGYSPMPPHHKHQQ